MTDIGTLLMKVNADTSNFDRGMSGLQTSVNNTARIVAAAALAMTAAIGAVAIKSIGLASDAEEMQNKYDVVFDGMTGTVDDWAETFASDVGRSKYDIMEYVSNLADLQQGLGLTAEESFNLSSQIVSLGVDLASFNNLDDAAAIDAISKAMLGEAESAKQLGLLLNIDRVKDFVDAQGLVYEELTDGERAQQVYNLAVTQSQNAIGDAERSIESFTNQMKALKSSLKDTATDFGMILLPAATSVVTYLNDYGIPALANFGDKAIEMGSKFIDDVVPKFESFIGKAKEVGATLIDEVQPQLDTLKTWISSNMPEMETVSNGVWDGIKSGAKIWVDYVLDDYIPALSGLGEWFVGKMPEWATNAEASFGTIKEKMQPIADTAVNVIESLLDLKIWFIETLPTMLDEAERDFEDIGIAIGGLATVVSETIGPKILNEFNELSEWAKSPDTKHGIQTTFYVIGAVISSVVEAVALILGTLINIVNTVIETFNKLKMLTKLWFTLMGEVIKTKMEAAKGFLEDVGQAGLDLIDKFKELKDWVDDKFQAIGETIGNAFDSAVSGIENFLGFIGRAIDALAEFIGLKSEANGDNLQYTALIEDDRGYTVSGQYANGGVALAGHSYLVGEQGAEIFTPSTSGTVSSGGAIININVNGSGDPHMVASQIVAILRAQGVAA